METVGSGGPTAQEIRAAGTCPYRLTRLNSEFGEKMSNPPQAVGHQSILTHQNNNFWGFHMRRLILILALLIIACEKDKPTAPLPEVLSFPENGGYNDIDTLGTGPFNAIIESYLTNQIDSMNNWDARDLYDVTLSQNGDIFLEIEAPDMLPVPVILSMGDLNGGFYQESAFGGDQDNELIERTYYQNRTVRIGIRIHDLYDETTDPPVDFIYKLRIRIP